MKSAFAILTALLAIMGSLSIVVAQDASPPAKRTEAKQEPEKQEKTESRSFVTADRRSPHVGFKVSIGPAEPAKADTLEVQIETTISKGWHVGPIAAEDSELGLPTKIDFESKDLVSLDKEFVPSVKPTINPDEDEVVRYHEGKFKWTRKYKSVKPINEVAAQVSIQFQVCNDNKCLPPKTVTYTLRVDGDSGDTEPDAEITKLNHKKIGEPIEVALEACKMKRQKVKLSEASTLSILFSGIPVDKLDLKGKVAVDSTDYDIYFAKEKEYSLKNTGSGKTRFENTSTYISIDHNGDGKIAGWESRAIDGPIRIADSMFRVTSIDRESKQVTFQQVDAPLSGAIVGRKCPPFKYTTTENETITDKSILGKVTILDIWAVT